MLYWIISRNIALLLVLYCTVLCSIVFVSCLAMHDAVSYGSIFYFTVLCRTAFQLLTVYIMTRRSGSS